MSSWDGKSKGTVLGYRIVFFCLRTFGLTATYRLVKVISFYYFLFARTPKRVLLSFYENRLKLSPRQAKNATRNNFYSLAQSLLDKIALSLGLGGKLQVKSDMRSTLQSWNSNGTGTIVLSGHVGNWAAAGQVLQQKDTKVNVVMFANEVEELKSFLEQNGAVPNFQAILIKDDLSHVIEIYKAIKAGELVCLLADRYLPGNPTIEKSFMGEMAHFPMGPFQLVEKLKANCMFIFPMKSDLHEYTVHAKICEGKSVDEVSTEFVSFMEEIVKQYPEQWYNYYDFYQAPK